jgi:hypothetical protein
MKRIVLAGVVGSTRQLLAIVIAVAAIAGAGYLVSHKLSNPDHYAYGGCPFQGIDHGFPRPCRPPTRAPWQIPLAIVIAVGGLGVAVVVVGDGRRRHVPSPAELGNSRL